MSTKGPAPRCARCFKLAADMSYLDNYWAEDDDHIAAVEEDERQRQRVEYARRDGTYNQATGSFWCDPCYIEIGMPLGVAP